MHIMRLQGFSLSRPPQNTKQQSVSLAQAALNVFPVGLQKHDALCVLGKREEEKNPKRACKLWQGVEKIKKGEDNNV